MPLLDVESQLLLAQQIGDVDAVTGDPVQPTSIGSTGIVMSNIARLWEKHAAKALLSPDLRDLYVQRDALDLVLGVLRNQVDFAIPSQQLSIKLSQRRSGAEQQRARVQEEITKIERALSASGVKAAQITAKVPIDPPQPGDRSTTNVFGPDANDPTYEGSPYWPPRRNPPL